MGRSSIGGLRKWAEFGVLFCLRVGCRVRVLRGVDRVRVRGESVGQRGPRLLRFADLLEEAMYESC